MCLAIPGQILDIFDQDGLRSGKVDFNGIKRVVCLECAAGCQIGDYVLVHVGFAISIIDATEAQRTLDMLNSSGQLDSELEQAGS